MKVIDFKLTYPEYRSILKKTYSPLSIIFKSSAASIISRIVAGLAHIITTKTIQLVKIEKDKKSSTIQYTFKISSIEFEL